MLGEGILSLFRTEYMLGRVGKTSLTLKYVHDTFNPDQISTINASYLEKIVNVGSEKV